jgi:hypothetical protein
MAKSKKTVAALAAKAGATLKSVSAVASKAAPSKPAATVAPTARSAIPLSARIVVVATANPKRPGTIAASKFPIYFALRDASKGKGFTVADLVKAFAEKRYPARRAFSALRFDGYRGFVKVLDDAGKSVVPVKPSKVATV